MWGSSSPGGAAGKALAGIPGGAWSAGGAMVAPPTSGGGTASADKEEDKRGKYECKPFSKGQVDCAKIHGMSPAEVALYCHMEAAGQVGGWVPFSALFRNACANECIKASGECQWEEGPRPPDDDEPENPGPNSGW